jgi:anti-sigma regulatory factor (Ser/Thr protein kinase)/ActR/RegA family two-component response regulator
MSLDLQLRQKLVVVFCCDEEVVERVVRVLAGWRVERLEIRTALIDLLGTTEVDLILTGRHLAGKESLGLLREVQATGSGSRVILQPGESVREDVIAAMRLGAFSYFSKPYFDAAFDEILRHADSDCDWKDNIVLSSATQEWLRIIARCELATADRIIQFMNEVSDLDGKDRESMGFALKEILMNAMEYGGQFNRERLVEVSYVRGRRMILYRIRDPGDGFSLEELTHAAISNPPEEPVRHLEVRDAMGIRPGGFGVMLTRKLVDDLIYSEQGNDVLLIKYLDCGPAGAASE